MRSGQGAGYRVEYDKIYEEEKAKKLAAANAKGEK